MNGSAHQRIIDKEWICERAPESVALYFMLKMEVKMAVIAAMVTIIICFALGGLPTILIVTLIFKNARENRAHVKMMAELSVEREKSKEQVNDKRLVRCAYCGKQARYEKRVCPSCGAALEYENR